MTVARLAYLLFLVLGYTYEQHLHRYQQLRRNNLVPKNSYHHSSSFGQGTCVLHELHLLPLYNQPPVELNTSVELISAHEHDLIGNALLESYSPFGEQDRVAPLLNFSEAAQRALSFDTSVSILYDTCIPTLR